MVTKDKLYIFYNDIEKNLAYNINSADEEPKRFNSMDDMYLMMVEMDSQAIPGIHPTGSQCHQANTTGSDVCRRAADSCRPAAIIVVNSGIEVISNQVCYSLLVVCC